MRWLLLLICLTSCTSQEHHFQGIAMKIPYHVIIGKSLSSQEKQRIAQIIEDTFSEVNQTFNHYNDLSELSELNHQEEMTLSPSLLHLIALSRNIHLLTHGKFDPTIGAAIISWKQALKEGHAPENLAACLSGFDNLEIEGNHCRKKQPIVLDLDGIAKGYTVDLITERLALYHNVFVNWGGDIRVLGRHPSGRHWTVQIGESDTVIDLENEAIATSGETYQIHILNPLTLAPLEKSPFTSVSVLAPSCALADSLATAAMVCETLQELDQLKNSIPSAHFLITNKK
ncbi:MAG: FAD:protein FMN transferase [Simkaniaceae bacterium]|nr:FAD:protein FMN transferase [Simkaniaceae bacterium]